MVVVAVIRGTGGEDGGSGCDVVTVVVVVNSGDE